MDQHGSETDPTIGEFAAAAHAINIEKGVILQIQNGNGSAFVVLQGS
ncbi:MAG: hypothetical protein P8M53_04075 [Pirellulales bacterium]|nr:hypothetical protein [Pirellulales bacterium]